MKVGVPTDEELEELGNEISVRWLNLGRRLGVIEQTLQKIAEAGDPVRQWVKGYQMLLRWKQTEGSTATYKVLHDALVHPLLQHRDLAEKFCLNG